MKFLCITHNKDSLYALPPETRVQIRTGAWAFIDKYLKAGKCKEIYFLGDTKGSVSIWEIESSEETARINLENPMLPFYDSEIIPIVEWDVGKKLITEAFEKAAKK